ncbi:hypothetical protein KRR39_05525 [Nocardioides panacis]|uniref:YbjN domain-containing protein n=1 Tax=Nocardioides panacis TaxID=2849501 RepID=A0A975Y184_9ACTN|nr:hypothetical protein [Nocardioides panacis]QWZ09247.1 hypothetical protein KRR39_05525 [Nocardioides panacis]
MGEFAESELDRSTTLAWSAFRGRLADHVAAMQDDEVALVEAESSVGDADEGAAPYVQFCAWGEDLVRCELSSNAYLAEAHRLDVSQVAALVEMGWILPTHGPDDEADSGSTNFHVDAERVEADRLAVMTVRAFREVFGVAHPAFLSSDDVATTDAPRPALEEDAEVDEALAVNPGDADHLRALVDAALVPLFGGLPEHDSDDDVPVVNGSGLVWVRVLDNAPVVQLFSALVHDVTDLERAAYEVAVLNRDVQFLKFLLLEDTVMAYLYVPALPFAPLHLRAMLDLMCRTVNRLDKDLATRVGGSLAFGSEPLEQTEAAEPDLDEAAHPALRTLIEIDAEAPGSVTPQMAAAVCDLDRELILELVTWSSERERTWALTRDELLLEGDPEDLAEVCDVESRTAERMTTVLRQALRLVVEQEAERLLEAPAYDGRRGPRPPRRRTRDDVLPGLDTREPGLFDQ